MESGKRGAKRYDEGAKRDTEGERGSDRPYR